MRISRTILLSVLMLMLAGLCLAQGAQDSKANSHIKAKYNKSKNETTVTLKTLSLSTAMNSEATRESEFTQLDLDAYFTFTGEQMSKPADTLVLKFKATAKNQILQRGQNVVVILDDLDALDLGQTKYTSNSQTFYFEEILTLSVPYDTARKIGTARTLAFKLGTRGTRLKEAQVEDLRALIARMTP